MSKSPDIEVTFGANPTANLFIAVWFGGHSLPHRCYSRYLAAPHVAHTIDKIGQVWRQSKFFFAHSPKAVQGAGKNLHRTGHAGAWSAE